MGLPIYDHPDGGKYVIDNPDVMIKMDDGRWEKGLVYRSVVSHNNTWQYANRHYFVTTYDRWNERFTKTEITTSRFL